MYGTFNFPHLPHQAYTAGVRLGPMTVVPGGANVHYLRSTGAADFDPPELAGRIHTTLNAACGQCRSGRGDTIIALEGHAENIASADQISNLVAGTQIIGRGYGTMRPTFTWTTATSTFLLDVANTSIENCVLNMDPGTGTTNVAAPITISAAGCRIIGNTIRMGTDSNSKVTIGITTTAGADDCEISGNHIYGATAAEATTFIELVGADRLKMIGNYIAGATSSTGVGIVRHANTASLDIFLAFNTYINRKASSTCAVTGLAAVSGVSIRENFHYLDDSSKTMWLTSPGIMAFFEAFVVNLAGENAVIATTVST